MFLPVVSGGWNDVADVACTVLSLQLWSEPLESWLIVLGR